MPNAAIAHANDAPASRLYGADRPTLPRAALLRGATDRLCYAILPSGPAEPLYCADFAPRMTPP
jgi:hypothetical protein